MDPVALFALGLALLAAGAPLLVFGAARLDRALGRSAFAVGAVGASLGPVVGGLAFDLAAALRQPQASQLAVGHLLGSTVASVGLVLGLAALARPVAASARATYTAVPLALAAVLLFWFLGRGAPNEPISQVGGGILLGAAVVALVLLVRATRRESEAVKAELGSWVPERTPVWLAAVFTALGLAALVGGAYLTAAELGPAANRLRTPWFVVGSTAAAFATALPTAVAAVVAARRWAHDLVLTLVVGPLIFNLLLVGGLAALAHPLKVEDRAILDVVPVTAMFVLLLLPVLFNGLRLPRWEGAVLLAAYAAFVTWQVRLAQKAG
jgi:cation:H+ antiporter